ncbi:MAG: methyltransferase [Opitutae bacterium]|nr:methyltransferase [Opitutae bacterium]|tara:strand:- start:122 stop:694 length:573 start_codon:yes stop_codon:yes gene_type:complete
MRISGGKAKGIKLRIPKGSPLRPAAEPVRERLFSSLGDLVSGAKFLDLFAGTGSYGLEALSRGAESGAFIEQDVHTTSCIQKNLIAVCKSANVSPKSFEVISGDALRAKPCRAGPFDLIFADPPYLILTKIAPKLFARLLVEGLANKSSLVIVELPGEVELDAEGWQCERRLGKARKGAPNLAFFRPTSA